jgi:hypothetical protein
MITRNSRYRLYNVAEHRSKLTPLGSNPPLDERPASSDGSESVDRSLPPADTSGEIAPAANP